MNQLHDGWDYKLYQLYIWGGFVVLVAYMVISTVVFEADKLPGPQAYLTIAGPLVLWVLGILAYWWWVFLVKSRRERESSISEQPQGVPAIRFLKDLNTLHEAMSVSGGSAEALLEGEKKAQRPMLIWFGAVNLLALWVLGFISLGALELLPEMEPNNGLMLLVGGVVFWVVGMFVLTPILVGRGGEQAEAAYLTPLGLAVTKVPSLTVNEMSFFGSGQPLIPDGPAIVEGERYGRLVHIETIDKYSLMMVQVSVPEFTVQSNDGKLAADDHAPEAIEKAIRSLRKAKRWKGVELSAGSEGIAIRRESRQMNAWLYDLWLAEYLLDHWN